MGIRIGIGSLKIGQGSTGVDWSSYWTPQYQAVLDAMTTEPSDTDKLYQAKMVKQLVDGGYFAKAEILDMFSMDTQANSLINMKSPGTFDPTLVSTPTFKAYQGFTGATGKAINLNFNEASDATLVSQNNICVLYGIGTNKPEAKDDFGALSSARLSSRSRHTDNKAYFNANAATAGSVANTNSIKHYALSRTASNNYDVYLNKAKTNILVDSTGLPNNDIYACAINYGTVEYSTRELRYIFIFSYLTESEVGAVMDIVDEYLSHYHTNLIDYDKYVASADIATKTDLTVATYDGGNETIHPSVVNVGKVWNGYQYWMANTPLTGGSNTVENPSIWASSDGETWVVPDGLTNPVIAKPADGYNADTDLFYNSDDDKLYMFWKETITSGTVKRVKVCSSSDGITWGDIKIALTPEADETECFTPSIVKIGTRFYMYYNKYLTDVATTTTRRVSCDTIDGTYGNREDVNLPVISGFIWWHIGAINYNGTIYIAGGKTTSSTPGTEIYIMKGADGINFERSPYPTVYYTQNTFEQGGYYRPQMCIIGTQPTMYYSKYSSGLKYGTAKVNIALY